MSSKRNNSSKTKATQKTLSWLHLQNKEDIIAAAGKCTQEEKNARIKTAHAIFVANLVTFLPFVETQATQTPNLLQEINQDINQEINQDPHHQL